MIRRSSVPRRRPRLISATVSSSPSRYLWISSSSISATASIRCGGASRPRRGAPRGYRGPRCCCPGRRGSRSAFISIRSMTPWNWSSRPIGIWIGHGVRPEAVLDRLDAAPEVGAGAVHLVDEAEARHAVAVGLAPDRLRLRLDTGDAVEDDDRAVEHAQAPLDLDREVHVPGRIDDVDTMVAPERRRRRSRDRDAPLLLLGHPVHRGRALMDLADLVDLLRVEEDPLGDGRLAGVDVRDDADVPRLARAEPVVPRSS